MTLLDTMNERFNNDTTVYNLIFEEDRDRFACKISLQSIFSNDQNLS